MVDNKLSDSVYRSEDLKALSESAYKKCLAYFLTLTFLEEKKDSEQQRKLQEHLRHGTGRLIYYVYTCAPTHYLPSISFMAQIDGLEMPESFNPQLSERGDNFRDDLQGILSEEEIYALVYVRINENINRHTGKMSNAIATLAIDSPRNEAHTEGDIIGMDYGDANTGLRLLQNVIRGNMWNIITL